MDPPSDDGPGATIIIPTSKKPDVKQYEYIPEWISNRSNLLRPLDDSSLERSPNNSHPRNKAPSNEDDVAVKVFFGAAAGSDKIAATTNNTSNNGTTPITRSYFGTQRSTMSSSNDGSSGWSTPNETDITPSETDTTSTSSSSSSSPSSLPLRSPLLLQQPSQSPEMKSESNRTEGHQSLDMISESTRTEGHQSLDIISESNRIGGHSDRTRTERQSKETMIEESLRTDAEIVSSESHRTSEQSSATLRSTSRSSLPHVFSSDIESSATATEKTMLSNEPSSRTTPREAKQQQPNEEDDDDDDDTGSEVSSSHSVASFWGNPVRFANPFLEKEEKEVSSQDAITDETDREQRNLELLVRDRPWMFAPTTKAKANEEEQDVLPDPPAAMDGSLRETGTRYRSRQTTQRSDWMPPVSSGIASVGSNHHCDDETMSVVTATIAETMQRLTQQEQSQQQSQLQQTDDSNSYSSTTNTINPTTSDSCAVVEGTTRTGGPSRRIDFAGRTTTHGYNSDEQNTKKKNNNNNNNNNESNNRESQKYEDTTDNNNSSSRRSRSIKIRKYYNNGRKANEKVRFQYMPTAIPTIANPYSDEESLFDWVPEQVRAQISQQGDESDEYIVIIDSDSNDEDIDVNTDIDVEANRGTVPSGNDGKSELGSSFYDEISIFESNKDNQSMVENDIGEDRRTDCDTIGIHSERDGRRRVAAAAAASVAAPGSDMNHASEKPSHIVHYVICLIIVLIPAVVFGIRFLAPR